jgi:hypothetical protein
MYGLTRTQQKHVKLWEAEGRDMVKEKDPVSATALSFFIGLGSFYTREPVLGVLDLLTWPISILWEPWISPANANKINYEATRDAIFFEERRERKAAMSAAIE